ncbi:putative fatty acid hydroxylase [Erysiphe necator]|uniref:Ceramide very long chain fatty acid hydroxylase n=1 Tax=Uncinula necator TaxID=52586 RepID=A0A0B1P141_UNCNE|nr:putative fatty acid hydroxylase [Erysiphe necator]
MTLSCTFPTYLPDEIAGHNNSKSCFVLMGTKVYDVTDFINSHPGGGDLILEYAGKDVTSILKNENSHTHSEAAYDVLEESLVGFIQPRDIFGAKTENAVSHEITLLPPTDDYLSKKEEYHKKPQFPSTGMSSAEDLSRETNIEEDFKTHRFLDLNKPLLMQVWNGGFSKDFYLEQIHRPRHFKGGASAPLFGNFLEPLSKTVWWVVPMVWLPFVIYGLYIARPGLSSTAEEFLYCLIGIFIWTLVEYFLHRFLFHLDRFLPENRVALTLHFLLHGIHHYLPMDKLRLVMPPALFLVLATPFWKLAHVLIYWNWSIATTVFCGGIFGYICYDLTHYFLHHRTLPLYWRELKKYHLQHHFMDYENGFGVTSRFWDVVFGTQLVTNPTKIK